MSINKQRYIVYDWYYRENTDGCNIRMFSLDSKLVFCIVLFLMSHTWLCVLLLIYGKPYITIVYTFHYLKNSLFSIRKEILFNFCENIIKYTMVLVKARPQLVTWFWHCEWFEVSFELKSFIMSRRLSKRLFRAGTLLYLCLFCKHIKILISISRL